MRRETAPEAGARAIELSNGMHAWVSAKDFEWLSKWRWHYSKAYGREGRCAGYAARMVYRKNWRKGRRKIYMHRAVLRAGRGVLVDHADGDGLNNCRSNLRRSDHSQNSTNRKGRENKTGFRGVWEVLRNGSVVRYSASIQDPQTRRRVFLGSFSTAEEAAHAYDEAAMEYHGAFAQVNFGDVWTPEAEPEGLPF